MAAEVRLGWDQNKEPNVVGYKVYYRQAHEDYDYERPVWFGPDNSCIIRNLEENTNYYFIVRAFTIAGEESDDSVEVEYDYEYDYAAMGDIGLDYGLGGNKFSAATGIGGTQSPQAGSGCFIGSVLFSD